MAGTTQDPDREQAHRLNRRGVLASAALAAAAPVVPATPAAAASGTTAGQQPRSGRGSVARLLGIAEHKRGEEWLHTALQVAVELELATIPPYLCAWWSVRDRGGQAARLIRRVIGDEMYHLGVVCNLLAAVGGRPRIKDAVASYPGPLPGGVRAGVTVYLSGLTRDYVHDVMMAIEAPDTPQAWAADPSPSIGDFYTALQTAFRRIAPTLSARGQLTERIGADVLRPVHDLDDVERVIEIVKDQGEGTSASPDEPFGDDQPAHYYAFGEIYHGRRLRETSGVWQFTGEPIPFPEARPMAVVPSGGWLAAPPRVERLLDHFDTTFTAVLDNLDNAWSGGGARALDVAVHAMRGLEAPALELMDIPLPDGRGTYGPQFHTRAR